MEEDTTEEEKIEFPMPTPKDNTKQFWKEVNITTYQVIHVMTSIFLDLLEIRISLYRLNPPRLLLSQSIQYFSMIVAYFLRAFVNSYTTKSKLNQGFIEDDEEEGEKLSAISAATLTLLDISCDASAKIALLLSPREKIESFFGFLSLLQTVISFFFFSQSMSFLTLFAVSLQTIGFLLVSLKVVGRTYEPTQQDKYMIFGLSANTAGYVFASFSLFLRCLNLTMTQMLSSSIRLTASSFCQGNGIWGLIITSAYHFFIYKSNKEKLIFLTPVKHIYKTVAIFVFVSALKHYTGFWLVLHTSAVEYTRVVMCSNLLMFAVRHTVFREDGATFGYTQVPASGIIVTLFGFALLCIVPLGNGDMEMILSH